MPPRPNKQPDAQQTPKAKPKPSLDLSKAAAMNLTVLKRKDPSIEEILASGGHVALYDFNTEKQAWSKKGVEGSLFVVKRRAQPRFQLFLLNKKEDDNYVQDIDDGFSFNLTKPYLFFRSLADEVIGMWFYDELESPKIEALLKKIVATFPSNRARDAALEADAATDSIGMAGFCGWKATVAMPNQDKNNGVHEQATASTFHQGTVPPTSTTEPPAATPEPNQLEVLLGIRTRPAAPAMAGTTPSAHTASASTGVGSSIPVSSAPRTQSVQQHTPAAPLAVPQQSYTPGGLPMPTPRGNGDVGGQVDLLQQLLAVTPEAPATVGTAGSGQPSGQLGPQQRRVKQLLQRLASNDAFVALLATEMQAMGITL